MLLCCEIHHPRIEVQHKNRDEEIKMYSDLGFSFNPTGMNTFYILYIDRSQMKVQYRSRYRHEIYYIYLNDIRNGFVGPQFQCVNIWTLNGRLLNVKDVSFSNHQMIRERCLMKWIQIQTASTIRYNLVTLVKSVTCEASSLQYLCSQLIFFIDNPQISFSFISIKKNKKLAEVL